MRKKIKLRPLILFGLLFTAVVFFLNFYMENRLKPVLKTYAEAKSLSFATLAINDAVCGFLEQENLAYTDLTMIEYGENGTISNIKTDIVALNQLKARLSNVIVSEMENLSRSEIKIPLGTLLGGEVFYGKGPDIRVKLVPVGGVRTDISNKFTAAGINQTRHQIYLEIRTNVYSYLTGASSTTDVTTDVAVAETVIVGDVPQMFASVGSDSSLETALGKLLGGQSTKK